MRTNFSAAGPGRHGGQTTLHGIRTRVREGIRRPSHTWRVRVWAYGRLCGVRINGRIRENDDDQWTKKVDRFLQPPVHAAPTTPSIPRCFDFSDETPSTQTLVMPRRNPTLPARTHEQTQIHVKAIREKHTGFQLLGSLVF